MSTINSTGGQKIAPFLWFDGKAAEAVKFYTSVFKNSKIISMSELDVPGMGKITYATFELEGVTFMALDAGPEFKFNPAISFFVNCGPQEEVDYFWEQLTANGGEPGRCGWLTDKFGVSWQIVPEILNRLMSDPDRVKAQNVIQAMMQMTKIDIAGLQEAHG